MKHKTIYVRIPLEDLKTIEKSAKLDRRKRSQFIFKAALEKAEKVLNNES